MSRLLVVLLLLVNIFAVRARVGCRVDSDCVNMVGMDTCDPDGRMCCVSVDDETKHGCIWAQDCCSNSCEWGRCVEHKGGQWCQEHRQCRSKKCDLKENRCVVEEEEPAALAEEDNVM